MDILLEIPAGLRGTDRAQLIDGGLQQLRDVLLNLLSNAGFFQRSQQVRLLNVGESAAKRTFDDIIIDHGHPRRLGNRAKHSALGTGVFAYPLQAVNEVGTVTSVAADCDWNHKLRGEHVPFSRFPKPHWRWDLSPLVAADCDRGHGVSGKTTLTVRRANVGGVAD